MEQNSTLQTRSRRGTFRVLRWALLFVLGTASLSSAEGVEIRFDANISQLQFAADEITRAIRTRPRRPEDRQLKVDLVVAEPGGKVQVGFVITSSATQIEIQGANATETMYGGLELAERIRFGEVVFVSGETRQQPYIQKRGIKFNIPLDARTPSYDDSGDAAQRNIAEMWRFEFWETFLNQLARDRYNMLSLWNPHPFPSMIRSDAYPDVALDDVCVTTLTPNGRENEWGEPQLVSANVIENLRVVRKISIEDKIKFWRKVLQHAENRGIDVYFINWNICPNSVAQPVQPYYRTYDNAITTNEPKGKYGVTHEIDNPDTVRYMRDAVKTFLLTYPTVKGIGVTSGEHMPISSERDREKWMWSVYGEGILDAKRSDPDRKVHFIHRVWNTNLGNIMSRWQDYPDEFTLGFKYAKARLYSSPEMPFADPLVESMKPFGLKAWWNLRNDDLYVHRWGDPDYVRAFLKRINLGATAGYHMGSDGYVWGREFISRKPETPRELEVDKHWYAFMLWGRLGYDPSLGRQFFIDRLALRFPDVDAPLLYETWQTASQIVPLVNQFYWRNWDHMWSVENSNSHVEGFHGVEAFCRNRTLQGSGLLSIADYVAHVSEGRELSGVSPMEVADRIDDLATISLKGAVRLSTSESRVAGTVGDIEGMAWLGRYYAAKIRAAVSLTLYRRSKEENHYHSAVEEIQNAYEACTRYVDHSQMRYYSQMLARTGMLDWSMMLTSARKDVAIVKAAK